MPHLIAEAEEIETRTATLKSELKKFFQDDELEFKVRWEHYLAWYRLGGEEHTYIWHGWDNIIPGHEEPMSYDCLVHADRYQTVDLVEALPNIMESLVCDESTELSKEFTRLEDAGVEDPYEVLEDHEVMVKLKEKLMQEGISSMYYDW